MNSILKLANREDGHQIIDIFNHYVENSFAAYRRAVSPMISLSSSGTCLQAIPF
jgi:L-amino acid N-acyltransferase YncA